jgi:hypothetical protein
MQANKATLDETMLSDDGIVHRFLQEHLLHWLEGLSLLQKTSESILMAQQLVSVIPVSMTILLRKIRTINPITIGRSAKWTAVWIRARRIPIHT